MPETPLLVAQSGYGHGLITVEHNGRVYMCQDILISCETWKALTITMMIRVNQVLDKAWDEIYELFDLDDTVFETNGFISTQWSH